MKSADPAPESRLPGDGPTDGIFYTNRCGNSKKPGCGRALTKLEILDSMGINPKRHSVCPCGSNSFRGANFKWWEEWLLIRSYRMKSAIKRKLVAPPPTKEEWEALMSKMIDDMNRIDEEAEVAADDLEDNEMFGPVDRV